jgi:hypothetical protein
MVPPPIWMRHSGTWIGTPRGSGVNSSCTTWSSTSPIPMVERSGAMRGEFCNGRRPMRSIAMPSRPQPRTTTSKVTGNGVPRYVMQSQPI